MSAYLNLPQPQVTADPGSVRLTAGGTAVVYLADPDFHHLSVHVEDSATARRLAAAFTKAAELLDEVTGDA